MRSSEASSSSFFPPKPPDVPADLARPSAKYRLHAWLAMVGLCLFGSIYVVLTSWFAWSAYRLFILAVDEFDLFIFIKCFGAAVLAVFMVKSLFFRKSSGGNKGYEITAETQPRLFDFLNRVAEEAGAPKPHKVYLSPAVNACVFYDLSLLNFLFPTKKNLEVGLGLINVVTLSELKAVLAHEFGHFAQKTMAVGRWVYTAQQVATQLIYHRDGLDTFLTILSGIDLRIAWIGWLLRVIVWSLRSLLDSLLSLVMLAERALSREMEFQADLVAVSTSGSDALIHGLYRLPAADGAWSEAIEFINEQIGKGHLVEDVFAVHSAVLEHKKRILNDPDYAAVPDLPASGADSHRIFTADIAQPPQMWATHPQSHLREANAKQRYIPAQLDFRSAWEIFDEPDKLRRDLSAYLFEGMKETTRDHGETMEALNRSYAKEFYNPAYRGVYLERSVVDYANSPDELYDKEGSVDPVEALNSLYPEQLSDHLETLRNLSKEKAHLEALRDRTWESTDGIIRFRGDVINRSGLGEAIETSGADLTSCREQLREHDRKCRSIHMQIARTLPDVWGSYLKGLIGVLHYADHVLRDLIDANGKLMNTYAVAIADGSISQKELYRLIADGSDLHNGLREVYTKREVMNLDGRLLARLKKKSWAECFDEDYQLPSPNDENMGDWLDVIGGWVGLTCSVLFELKEAALEELLKTEAMLAEHARNGTPIGDAPNASEAPLIYRKLLHGKERSIQMKLNWWDSFQTASGPIAATTRFLVSFGIILLAVYITFPEEWLRRLNLF